jgi:hypothetical protein
VFHGKGAGYDGWISTMRRLQWFLSEGVAEPE